MRALIITAAFFLWCACSHDVMAPSEYDPAIERAAQSLETVYDVTQFMRQFDYQPDDRKNFPTIGEVFAINFVGDCKTSSVMAKWALECVGRSSRIVVLYYNKGKDSHAITVTNDNTIMVSGHTFGYLDRNADWITAACSFCGNYDYLIDKGIVLRP